MRKIQLRVWDNEEKIMIYSGPDYPFFEIGGMYLEDILEEYNSGSGRFVVMQSTGLKDRDGEEMWEGDIVKFCLWSDCDTNSKREWDVAEIVWDDFGFGLRPGTAINTLYKDKSRTVMSKYYKVIGNAYENPGLGGQSVDGDISVSKTEEEGSSPSAPAKVKIVKDYGGYDSKGGVNDRYFGSKVEGGVYISDIPSIPAPVCECVHRNLLPLRMSEYIFFSSQTHSGTAKCLQVDTYICRDCGEEISLKDIKNESKS